MKKVINKTKLTGVIFLAVFIIMALIAIIGNLVMQPFDFSVLVYIFIICVICFILTIIFYSCAVKGRPWFVEKKREKLIPDYSPDTLDFEAKKRIRPNKGEILTGIIIFLVCCLGASPLFIFASKNIQKIHGPNYVKTEAVVTSIADGDVVQLRYVYYTEDGERIVSGSNASFGGISFKEGKKITVYYNKDNPELLADFGESIMMLTGGSFFLLCGLIVLFANLKLNQLIGLTFGITFMAFSGGFIFGVMNAGGMNFFEIYCSGVVGYALTLFFILGLFFATYSLFQLIISIICYFKKLYVRNKYGEKKEKPKKIRDIKVEKEKQSIIKKERVRYFHRFSRQAFGILFAALVFLFAGGFMFSMGVRDIAASANYQKVQATVIEVRLWNSKEDGSLLGDFVYEYYIDGKRYEHESSYSQSAELLPEKGETITIKVSRIDPNRVVDSSWINWLLTCVSLIPLGVGVFLCFLAEITMRDGIKEKKQSVN